MLPRSQGALKPGNRWCLRTHELGYLCLREAGFLPCLEQRIERCRFLALESLNLGADRGPAYEFLDELVMGSHVSPRLRRRPRSCDRRRASRLVAPFDTPHL